MNPAGKSLGEKAPGAFLLPPTMQAGLLVMIAGYADAIGFLQHRAFAGQMTGNTILLAISMAEAGWSQTGFYLAVIISFLIGVAISGSLVRLGYAQAIALSLAAVALAICAFVTTRWGALLLAFAMGAQNAAATHFGAATINTVFITGDLQKLFEKVLGWLWQPRSAAKDEASSAGFAILALVWVEYFAGALIGALAHATLSYPLLIPAVLLPFVLLGRSIERAIDQRRLRFRPMASDAANIAARPVQNERDQSLGGSNGEEAVGSGLPDHRCRRRQREVVGGGWPQCGGNGRRLAARPARGGGDEDGHEGREGQGHRFPHARSALVQIRGLSATRQATFAPPLSLSNAGTAPSAASRNNTSA